MNDNQKRILILIVASIVLLIFNIISLSVSYSNLNTQNMTHEVNVTNSTTSDTSTTEEVVTKNSSTTTKSLSTTQSNTDIENTTNKKSTKTTEKNTITPSSTTKRNTMKVTIESIENEEVNDTEETLDKMYYYSWTKESERDYTGRNCLFIYDEEGRSTEGYANIIYYSKYKKKQYISNDANNCFLEDMYSVEVESIIVDGVKYE